MFSSYSYTYYPATFNPEYLQQFRGAALQPSLQVDSIHSRSISRRCDVLAIWASTGRLLDQWLGEWLLGILVRLDTDGLQSLQAGEWLLGEWLLGVLVWLDSNARHSLWGGEWLLGEWPLGIIMLPDTDSELLVKELLCVSLRLDTGGLHLFKDGEWFLVICLRMCVDGLYPHFSGDLTRFSGVSYQKQEVWVQVPCNHHPWAFWVVPRSSVLSENRKIPSAK